jgi:hypothetical protein
MYDGQEKDRIAAPDASSKLLGEAPLPLETILLADADDRLALDPATGLSAYGCRARPAPDVIDFASSTASTISQRGFAAAGIARIELYSRAARMGWNAAIDTWCEEQREELTALLGISDAAPAMIFSASGTDTQLQALFLVRATTRKNITNIVTGADETGSGVPAAASGRHFNASTSQGIAIEKGALISGLGDGVTVAPVALRDAAGNLRAGADTDAEVKAIVARTVAGGGHALLQVMDSSKFGWSCPSIDALHEMRAAYGPALNVLVDACQTRLSRSRLNWYLQQGFMVLLAGSKFFCGPAFSGILLVPASLGIETALASHEPDTLRDYSSRADWPRAWRTFRTRLPERWTVGQVLRREAAIAEMRAYFAAPSSYRRLAARTFASAAASAIGGSPEFELLPGCPREPVIGVDEEEMSARSIFPFYIRRGDALMSAADCAILYRALNRDISGLLPASVSDADRALAARLCHIGQPVPVRSAGSPPLGAIRISAGARLVSDTWKNVDASATRENLRRKCAGIGTVLDKARLVVRHFDRIAVGSAAQPLPAAAAAH